MVYSRTGVKRSTAAAIILSVERWTAKEELQYSDPRQTATTLPVIRILIARSINYNRARRTASSMPNYCSLSQKRYHCATAYYWILDFGNWCLVCACAHKKYVHTADVFTPLVPQNKDYTTHKIDYTRTAHCGLGNRRRLVSRRYQWKITITLGTTGTHVAPSVCVLCEK